jgi:hypothetical protein
LIGFVHATVTIIRLFRRVGERRAATPLALFITLAGCFAWTFSENYYHWEEILRIEIGDRAYLDCPRHGVHFAQNQVVSLCSVNNDWWRSGFTEAVVFDSSRQFDLDRGKGSDAWMKALLSLGKDAPFEVAGFEARRLTGSYYSITFQLDGDDTLSVESEQLDKAAQSRRRLR